MLKGGYKHKGIKRRRRIPVTACVEFVMLQLKRVLKRKHMGTVK